MTASNWMTWGLVCAMAATACSEDAAGPSLAAGDTVVADAAGLDGASTGGTADAATGEPDAAAGDSGSDSADTQSGADGGAGDGGLADSQANDAAVWADGSGDAAAADAAVVSDAVADAVADTMGADAGDALTDTPLDAGQVKGVPSATITAPKSGTVIEAGQVVTLSGTVADTLAAASDLVVTWSSDKDGVLGTGQPDAQGLASLAGVKLSPGKHLIQLEVKNPQGISATDAVSLGVCSWKAPESFDTKLDGGKWKVYGDAYWDAGGWLEMTGNAQGKFGKIWNIADYVAPGDVQISFQIATGGGINGGADGFALSVIDAKDVTELESILAKAGNGGCLGYGVAGGCGNQKIGAFHVEIDTFHNTGDPNTDPTFDNHIAVTLDGDPSKHWLWAATPAIEDLQWHTVTVEVKLDKVRVTLDSKELFNQSIADFKFRGGYIGFSGSTGWASNFHRIDNLQILQQCLVQ